VLPIDNLSGTSPPMKSLVAAIDAALGVKFELVQGDTLERFLSRHRIRFTGGLDAETARAARDELGADAVLVTSLELYRRSGPAAFGMAMRLVSAGDEPVILWMDEISRTGDESPGLLGLGLVHSVEPLQADVIRRLVASLTAAVKGSGPRFTTCGGFWYGPRIRFRSLVLDERHAAAPTLAVIPFLNMSERRGAGDAVSLEFVRHLVASGRFRVYEPGVVRDFLLRQRVMLNGGVSLEATRLFLAALGTDYVVSGVVLDFDDTVLGARGPSIRFSATLLDGGNGEVVWQSGSYNRGDDGVFAFGLGRVATPGSLSCKMVGEVVREIERPGRGLPRMARDEDRFRYPIPGAEAKIRSNAGAGGGGETR
jgi:TolB-like protein